ncbi:NADH oxidoreductase hcr [bacterium BMS3Abin07]|nr:NADH oxidoreductase hcr [bacterium BMS3Abin07]GBE33036.1 NADH oxidoreductase hcr [bacterium BMS3Bbin05]HDL20739.1 DUF4445 domain-containing protein [Nitrospirota bacterium]HDO21622.1 DUF4445 domain-containing protein [Nitrospirota bacterium]HDZ88269.1 DUF4445 domain-containing protein [Nitrospirota bacterium]
MKLILSSGEEFQLDKDESLYNALRRHEEYIVAPCGGKGICGKCIVRVIEGEFNVRSHGKLSETDIKSGLVLACQTFPESDIFIEVPQVSRLIVGDKIAIGHSREFLELFDKMGARPSSLIRREKIKLALPTIDDNVSDLERLKQALNEAGLTLYFSKNFTTGLSDSLRKNQWTINLCYEPVEKRALFAEPPGSERSRYGLAVDIGTTTIVADLVDLSDGRIIDVGSTYNSQMRYGDDVITRIVFATEGGGLNDLKDAVTADINNLSSIMCDRHSIDISDVECATIAGNTTMSHMFWGLNPEYIREEPYIPTVNRFPLWDAGDARLDINPVAPVYTVPCIASYVGGDVVAGVLASQMHRNPEISLFMDIGTNGEIVIGNNEWLMTAACSAGPCFEGSGIRCGMRATKGAIESINFDRNSFEPSIGVVNNAKPLGICGSGMIDAVAGMYLTGIIDQKGKLAKNLNTDRVQEGPEGYEFVFHRDRGGDIVLTEVDIENILRAKAAIYAGISLLIKQVGLTPDVIEKVYIAGGFGNYLDIKKGIIIGMLPDLPEEKYIFLGNTSIAGAYLSLMSEDMRNEAETIASKMTYVELSVSGNFMDEYMSAMFLPHTDISLFPSVRKLIGK